MTISTNSFGVYVHVPFCAHRCDYCAFATYADRDHLMNEYVTSVLQEIEWSLEDGLPVATSVFFGGGTPLYSPPISYCASWGPFHERTTPK